MTHDYADYVEAQVRYATRNPAFTLTPAQRHVIPVLCTIGHPWNLHADWRHATWLPNGVSVTIGWQTLSTTDDDRLTRLVIAAHDAAVRVEVSASHEWAWAHGMPDQAARAEVYRHAREVWGMEPDSAREVVERFADGAPGTPALEISLHVRKRTGSSGWEYHPPRSKLADVAATLRPFDPAPVAPAEIAAL